MDYVIVALVGVFASALTLFSGFGLGTLLMPVYALFFPAPVAVAATGVVHGANNLFKLVFLWRDADWRVAWRFGVPAVLAAVAGALLLGWLSGLEQGWSWRLIGLRGEVTLLKLLLAVLIAGFALFELSPRLRRLEFGRRHLALGGLLSGFFGGLSGHQGALRSAFLAQAGLTPAAFVATGAVLGFLVDAVRVPVYGGALWNAATVDWTLVATGCGAAFAGVLLGKRLLPKVTIGMVQTWVGILLFCIALLMGAGLI